MKMPRPYTYVDDDGTRYYNVQQAAKVVENASNGTVWNWAARGVTSFGFKLDVRHEPLIHAPFGTRHNALRPRESRMLIPEAQVLALKEILQRAGRINPGPGLSNAERDRLEVVARYYKPRSSPLLS
jgi:hypothetical protein